MVQIYEVVQIINIIVILGTLTCNIFNTNIYKL